jgi:twitching motility protein PilT
MPDSQQPPFSPGSIPAPPPPPGGMPRATGQPPSQTLPMPATATATAPRPQGPPTAPARRAPTGLTMEQLVREAYEKNFSDIHLGVGEVPRFRDRGRLDPSGHPVTDLATFDAWLEEILEPDQIEGFRTSLEFDGAKQYEGMARVRINIFDSLRGPGMVLRLIPLKILTLEQLGLPPVFQDLCHYHKGLILVTGPTGSGKSTTMAAMIDYINSEMSKHIVSIEDPIEFVHQSRKAMIRQREVGIHTHKFDNALKASLREDPDIILIGEMRDRETVNTALKAAQTGHLVFGTLHTNSAVKTIERILNLYNPEEQGPMRMQVAESLVGVIAQSLVRTTDGKRAAIHEIMINTDAIKDFILRGEVEEIEAMIPQCTYDGMCTMNQCLYELYETGRIDEETALENSPKPNEMAQILRGRV